MKLKDKVAIITGASKGIGRSIALALAKEGAHLVLCSRNIQAIEQYSQTDLADSHGKTLIFPCDITQPEDIQKVVDGTLKAFGKIDILINNAGIWLTDKVADSDPDDFDLLMKTNYMGTYLFARAVLPTMIRQNSGDIVNISSILGQFGASERSGYCASKFAVSGFSQALRQEVRSHHIRVIVICPGTTDTDLFGEPVDTESSLSPHDVAETVRVALTLPQRANITELTILPTNP